MLPVVAPLGTGCGFALLPRNLSDGHAGSCGHSAMGAQPWDSGGYPELGTAVAVLKSETKSNLMQCAASCPGGAHARTSALQGRVRGGGAASA